MAQTSVLTEASEGLAEAVRRAEAWVVTVAGRPGYPASGVAWRPDRVLTASHVLEQEEEIRVILPDGRSLPAELAGRDPVRDLALLRLAEGPLPTPVVAEAQPRVGQLVLALGRPTSEGIQASLGVVNIVGGSYQMWRGENLQGVMRADAERFPGFSGGALVDAEGRLLGINTHGRHFGSSLTIPAADAWATAEKLERNGNVQQAYLGIRSQPVSLPKGPELGRAQDTGLLVIGVETDSPAERAGIMVGDILVALAGSPAADHLQLLETLRSELVGQQVDLQLVRAGELKTLQVTVGGRLPSLHQRRRRVFGHHRFWP
jgi:S1-C subfamily serine protease